MKLNIIRKILMHTVNQAHCIAHSLNNKIAVYGLCKIFKSAQVQSLLGILKLIVGTQNYHYDIGINLLDKGNCFKSVEARHLNIHKNYVNFLIMDYF